MNDLLRDESSNHTATLSAHLDSDGTVDVHNLTRVKVSDGSTINELMEKAARMRSVGKTSMNARSSRSHGVFTLRIKGELWRTACARAWGKAIALTAQVAVL